MSSDPEGRAHLVNQMKQEVDANITQGSSMYKDGYDDGIRQEGDNKQKKVLCVGAIITLIVAAIVLIVVLVPTGDSSSGGDDKPVDPDAKCAFNEMV